MDFYDFPARLVTDITDRLCAAGVFNRVLISGKKEVYGFQLAVDPSTFSVGSLTERLYQLGASDFIPKFRSRFPNVITTFAKIESNFKGIADSMLISSLLPPGTADTSKTNINTTTR